jgi:ribonuclease P protein component
MLPAKHRLRLENDIKTLLAKGRSVFSTVVGAKTRPNAFPFSRFAVVVGVKTDKRAVVRNRIKRRVRAIIHEQLGNIRPGYDVCFFPKKTAFSLPADKLKMEVLDVLKKAKLL